MEPGETIVLEVVPGRSPEPVEVEQVVRSITRFKEGVQVVLDLSRMELLDSSFMARMIMMNRRIRTTEGRLFLKGLQPVVRDIFDRARLGMALDLAEGEPESKVAY
jgi:anti-anti-sigma factor